MLRIICTLSILFFTSATGNADTISDNEAREIIRRELSPSNPTINYRDIKITLHNLTKGYDFSPFLSQVYKTLRSYSKHNKANVFHIIYDENVATRYNNGAYIDTLGVKVLDRSKCFYRKYSQGNSNNFNVASIFIDKNLSFKKIEVCLRKYFLLLNGRNYCESCEFVSDDEIFQHHLILLNKIEQCKLKDTSVGNCYEEYKNEIQK